MTLQETAKHFRKRLKAAKIASKCKCYLACGKQYIQVSTPTYEAEFTEEQQKQILLIAYACHLIRCDYQPIDINQMTYTKGGSFILPW